MTIVWVKVNEQRIDIGAKSLEPGEDGQLSLEFEWVYGNAYKFDLYDGSWQIVGSYQTTAPV